MTWQPSHQHSMWALFEGTRTFNYFVSILVSSTVNCLDAKKKFKLHVYPAPSTPMPTTNKMALHVLWWRSRESRQILWEDGKAVSSLSAEGKLPSQVSSTKMPTPCFTAGGIKGSIKGPERKSVRAGMSRWFPAVFLLPKVASQDCWWLYVIHAVIFSSCRTQLFFFHTGQKLWRNRKAL